MIPQPGFVSLSRTAITSRRKRSRSPGRTGCSHFRFSNPSPKVPGAGRYPVPTISIRIVMLAVCHPLAISPPVIFAAATGSVCIGCGSNLSANAIISASSIVTSGLSRVCPATKSSKYMNSVIFGLPGFRLRIAE